MAKTEIPAVFNSRHPTYLADFQDWEKYRLTYRGGESFRDRYLKKFSTREDDNDFRDRKDMTPIPAFAKGALNDIRNAIFQRLGDVVRRGGSAAYQSAIGGEQSGVDLRGSTMNYYLGNKVLTEMLIMGKVGVYVDMPEVKGPTLADVGNKRPYLYHYCLEDILNYSCTNPEEPSEFQSVLLRDVAMQYDERTALPTEVTQRYRMVWVDKDTRRVNIQFYDLSGNEIDRNGRPGGPVELSITRIPFVMCDIGDSLLKDVAQHQIALLNLGSSDVNYALKANFPFYTEQRDKRGVGDHLKLTATDGTATTGGQGASDQKTSVGPTMGRYYDMEAERPGFIAPPSEPLQASMKLQEKLEQDIRKLVNLAVVGLASRASADSKAMDNQGLEAGLSFIGLVLEGAERRIADYWSAYESAVVSGRQVAIIKYPDRYSLKSDMDRISEADKLKGLMSAMPGRTVKREIAKTLATVLLNGKVTVDVMATIHKEIDNANYTTSDPEVILAAKEQNVIGDQTAAVALGFDDNEHLKAAEDQAKRAERVAEAQAKVSAANAPTGDPAARGLPDLSADPKGAAKEEKAASQDRDGQLTNKRRTRGEGK